MTLRRALLVGTIGLTAVLTAQSASVAAPAAQGGGAQDRPGHGAQVPPDSLRALGAKVGLRVGTAVNMDLLGKDAAYTGIVNSQFSTVTPENVMKWEAVEPKQGTYDWAAADRLVASAKANGQLVRGHNLVWHSQLPTWLSKDGGMTSTFTSAQLKAILKKHVQDEARHFRGQIWQWDVVNEAFNDDGTPRQDIWYKAWGGTGYIADAFRWAHEADPKAELFYNDYNIEFTGPKSNAVYALVKQMKAQGVPIDGVGFQTHLSTAYGFPDLRANLQRFADLGLDVAETEVDIRTSVKAAGASAAADAAAAAAAQQQGAASDAAAADVTPDAAAAAPVTYTDTPVSPLAHYTQEAYWSQSLQACLLVKRCISYTVWGVADANSWIPGVFPGEGAALLWDDAYKPKGEYTVVQQDLELAAGAPHRSGRGAGSGA